MRRKFRHKSVEIKQDSLAHRKDREKQTLTLSCCNVNSLKQFFFFFGPGKCLFLSGLTEEQLNYMHDQNLPEKYSIGFTNMVERTTPGSKDLSRSGGKKEGASCSQCCKISSFRHTFAFIVFFLVYIVCLVEFTLQ